MARIRWTFFGTYLIGERFVLRSFGEHKREGSSQGRQASKSKQDAPAACLSVVYFGRHDGNGFLGQQLIKKCVKAKVVLSPISPSSSKQGPTSARVWDYGFGHLIPANDQRILRTS